MNSRIRIWANYLAGAMVVLGCACSSNSGTSASTGGDSGGQSQSTTSSKGGEAGQSSSAAGASGGSSSSMSSQGGRSTASSASSSANTGGQSTASAGATGGTSSSAKGGTATTSPAGATAGTGGGGQGGNASTSSATTSTSSSGGTGGSSSVGTGGNTEKDAGASDANGTGTSRKVLLADEGNRRVVLMDMQNPSAAVWSRQLDSGKYGDSMRDIQLVGGDRVAVSVAKGYVELDLKTGEVKKEVTSFNSVESLRRLPSGNTILGSNENGVTLQELDPKDTLVPGRKVSFSLQNLRLFRRTPQGTFLLGVGNDLVEVNWDKQTLWSMNFTGGSPTLYVYMGLRIDKNIAVTTGYGCELQIIEPTTKKLVATIGGKNQPDANIAPYFYAGFQLLPNGHYVVTNWEGHGGTNGGKGIQLLEYDASGAVVWKWKQDSKLVSSLHHVIVLDGLDTTKLHDDVNGVLAPVDQ